MYRELNLVPKVYNDVKLGKKRKQGIIVGGIATLLLLTIGVGYTIGYEMYLNKKRDSLERQKALYKEAIDKDAELTNEIETIKAHIKKATELQSIKSKKTNELFEDFQTNFPPGVVLENLEYNQITITGRGIAASEDLVNDLWAKFRESKNFKNSNVLTKKNDGDKCEFTFEITLLPVGGVK